MVIFVTLWTIIGTFVALSALWLWEKYRHIRSLSAYGGIAVLTAVIAGLLIMGHWDPLVWNLFLTYLVFGMMGWLSSRVSVRVIRWLLLVSAAVCVPLHDSSTFIPGIGMVDLPRWQTIVLDWMAIFLTVSAVRSSLKPEGLAAGTFLGIWSLLFLFFSKTAFGATWGWNYALLEAIAAAHVGSLATFCVFNSAPALVGLGGSGAFSLAGGLAICFCVLRTPLILIGLLSLPYLQLCFPRRGIIYFQNQGIGDQWIVPVFCFTNTFIAHFVLQFLNGISPLP